MNDLDELAQSTAESIGRHIDKDGYQPEIGRAHV